MAQVLSKLKVILDSYSSLLFLNLHISVFLSSKILFFADLFRMAVGIYS